MPVAEGHEVIEAAFAEMYPLQDGFGGGTRRAGRDGEGHAVVETAAGTANRLLLFRSSKRALACSFCETELGPALVRGAGSRLQDRPGHGRSKAHGCPLSTPRRVVGLRCSSAPRIRLVAARPRASGRPHLAISILSTCKGGETSIMLVSPHLKEGGNLLRRRYGC
jgi:hypothetical protein